MSTTVKGLLEEAAAFLRDKGLSSPRLEVEVLLSFLLGKDRSYLYAHGDDLINEKKEKDFWEHIRRRGEGVPAAYITRQKEFMGLNFYVEEGVFIPRPETEHLVETVIDWVTVNFSGDDREVIKILELGCGSGNIAVSLAYYLPAAEVLAVEREEKPVMAARLNSRRIGVDERVKVVKGNFFEPLRVYPFSCKFHVIVSNPPYILHEDMAFLPREVKKEPAPALNGGIYGLNSYKEIFIDAGKFLLRKGLLALEIDEGIVNDTLSLGEKHGFIPLEIRKDYAGRKRVAAFEQKV